MPEPQDTQFNKFCVFCRIAAGTEPAEIVFEWPDAVAFRPLNPVTDGHLLVIPRAHVADALEDTVVTASTMARAADAAFGVLRRSGCNLITSVGIDATQTVFHLHIHVVPRRPGDGLLLPWSEVAA